MEAERLIEQLNKAMKGNDRSLLKESLTELLTRDDFAPVYKAADEVRRRNVGDIVHLRAIIEFSNICKRQCSYCGLNRNNRELMRFRMTSEEIMQSARRAVEAGYRTIVLQSGEDDGFPLESLGDIVEEIKSMAVPDKEASSGPNAQPAKSGPNAQPAKPDPNAQAGIVHPAVTISCGELSREAYAYLKNRGADRYLLKHETADPKLYKQFHPCGSLENRTNCLKTIYELGYETGSGFMVGLPGQTPQIMAEDLMLLREIPCQMAGIGPFISNPKTELAGEKNGDPELTRRAVALARLLIPKANLPVTTALSILTGAERNAAGEKSVAGITGEKSVAGITGEKSVNGRAAEDPGAAGTASADANPFAFGANVVMKKVTPDEYKAAYEIYPAEYKPTDIAGDRKELERIIKSYGRIPL